jgi:hypothetical protein
MLSCALQTSRGGTCSGMFQYTVCFSSLLRGKQVAAYEGNKPVT